MPADKPKNQSADFGPSLWVEDEFAGGELASSLSRESGFKSIPPIGPADYPAFGAGDLILTRHRGGFIKPCPGTLNYTCCGLSIFHFGLGCTLGCRYCILSAYLGTEALVLFGNIEEGLRDLEKRLAAAPTPDKALRYCTGEFTDSLLLDKRSALAARLIRIFAGQGEALLELKTKTDYVDHLLHLDHKGRTVISFSVNSPDICAEEEGRAAPLKARLRAAARASAAGYPIGLHFDPLIFKPGWEAAYQRTTDLIGEHLAGAEVAWVSMGCFRYLPALKERMLSRHPETAIYDAEFITGGDGKMRYPRPVRSLMYKALLAALHRVLPASALIYMCMESPRLWREVFGFDLGTEGLTRLLDDRARALAKGYPPTPKADGDQA